MSGHVGSVSIAQHEVNRRVLGGGHVSLCTLRGNGRVPRHIAVPKQLVLGRGSESAVSVCKCGAPMRYPNASH